MRCIMNHGSNNTDSGDNSAAFTAAAAADPSGQACAYFPLGMYDFSSQIDYALRTTNAAIEMDNWRRSSDQRYWNDGHR